MNAQHAGTSSARTSTRGVGVCLAIAGIVGDKRLLAVLLGCGLAPKTNFGFYCACVGVVFMRGDAFLFLHRIYRSPDPHVRQADTEPNRTEHQNIDSIPWLQCLAVLLCCWDYVYKNGTRSARHLRRPVRVSPHYLS